MTHPRILAIMPAYNEQRGIASLVRQVRKFAHDVLAVDDASRDAAANIARAAGARES